VVAQQKEPIISDHPANYEVHGNVVEHLTPPRFRTIVTIHDGQSAGIRRIEWIGSHRHITATHAQFLAATAMLAWSLKHLS
jgi:hypothetical protein